MSTQTWLCVMVVQADQQPIVAVNGGEVISRTVHPVLDLPATSLLVVKPRPGKKRVPFGDNNQAITISAAIARVGEYFGVSADEIVSHRNDRVYSIPRQIAMYLAKELTDCSYPALARAFDRHHTTVMYGVEQVRCMRQVNSEFDSKINHLRRKITGLEGA